MKKGTSKLIEPQKAELEALAALPDGQINTQVIPEQRDWNSAQRGGVFSTGETANHIAARCRLDFLVQDADRRRLSSQYQQCPA